MSHKRKTVGIAGIKAEVNRLIALPITTPEARRTLGVFLSNLLMETGNYDGFNYIEWSLEGGAERWRKDGEPDDTKPYLGDPTRVFYY